MRMKYWMLALASTFLLSFQAVAQNVAKVSNTEATSLPKATVTRLDAMTLMAGNYSIYNGSLSTANENLRLQAVVNFKAEETVEQAQVGGYGDYACDFYLSFSGLKNGSIDGSGCYLAGCYGESGAFSSLGWIAIPTDIFADSTGVFTITENVEYPVLSAYDANLTYENICDYVKDFTAAIYVKPEILEANPDFKVSLALKMREPNTDTLLTVGDAYVFDATTLKKAFLPTATVTTVKNDDLTFALNFKADAATDVQLETYGNWYADFVLTVNKDVTFNANGGADGYLSGQYDAWSENWVNVPFEDVKLKANESLKIMAYAAEMMGQSGLKLTYNDVYSFVKDFDCGVFFEPAFLAANPDLKVTLELRMYNPANETESYVIGETYTFPVPLPTATVTTVKNDDLTFALNFKADAATDVQLAAYGEWYADFVLTVNKDVTFNANGGADGYLSGQYDEWSENWVNVPFENVTLKANESLKIMAYAAEMLNQGGLKLTYNDVYSFVKDFDCGVFFESAFLAANPDLKVTLELRMYNPANEAESYVIGETYTFNIPTVEVKNEVSTDTMSDKQKDAVAEIVTNTVVTKADTGLLNATAEITAAKEVLKNQDGVTAEAVANAVPVIAITVKKVDFIDEEPSKLTFDVTPTLSVGETSVEMNTFEKALTFRLPIPTEWAGLVKVSHDGTLMGTYTIQESEGAKFVELSSASFSEFAIEPIDTALVAKIGDTPYATLADAVAAVADNTATTITLIDNVTLTEPLTIPAGKTVTLDLNGKTINGAFNGSSTTNHIYALENRGTLTITDTSAEQNGAINSRGIYNYGSLTLNAGKIAAIDGNGGYAVNNKSGSTFVMNGGWIAADYEDGDAPVPGNYDATALNIPTGCTATLNGGKITNAGNFTYAIAAAGTLNIPATSTLAVEGRHGAIAVSGGTTTINAGTFKIPANTENTDNVLYVSGGALIINGGTFTGDSDTAAGGCCVYDANGGATINGGSFSGSSGGDVWGTTGTTIKGGTFENLTETKHIADGYELGENGQVVAKPVVAKIGETPYATLQAALAAAQAGDTITLLADVTCTEKPVFSKGGIVNVDVNGHVFVSTEQARVRNVASADGAVPSNNIKFVSGFGWEVYSPKTTEGVSFRVFPTLDAVMAYEPAKPNPARIYPYEDVKQEKDVVLRKYGHGTSSTICIDPEYDITWDLNGYTVLQESPTGNPLEACVRGKFTLKDSSDEQTGKWIAGACGVTNPANGWYGNGGPALYLLGEGELVLEGGTISIARNATLDTAGNEVINSGGLIRVDSGKLNVNGATLQVDDTYGVMAWGGEIEINAVAFDIDPAVSVPVYAIGYYEDVAVEVNSTFAGALCVYGNVAGYKGASATVNVAGVEYATGSGWIVPSVGEGLMTFNGLVLEEGIAVVTSATSVNTYATLADAITAAQAGDTITVVADVTLTETLTIPADKTVTLDLKGKTISQTKTQTAAYEMILNDGNLTIQDTVGGGKISYTDLGNGGEYVSDTIMNRGTLTLLSGTIENHSSATVATNGYPYAIDTSIWGNASEVNTIIKGGKVYCASYSAMRLFGSSTTEAVNVTVEGGEIVGTIEVQSAVTDAAGKLTISGGKLSNSGTANVLFFFGNNATTALTTEITGGEFTGAIKFSTSANTFNTNIIKGGTFSSDVSAYVATGYACTPNADGTYGVIDDPATHYIATLNDFIAFRDSVNAGTTYEGVTVYLTADIDLTGVNWVGIGSINQDHGFMGNFDGKTFKIKNLTITNPTLVGGYAYAGLFSITEGTDQNNQNTIKNLTIENVTINTTGHIVSAAIAYPYYTIVENVKVCGNINVIGGDYTAGALAYTRRCVKASNISVIGNDASTSTITGAKVVGGVIADIQMNDGLIADYSNFKAENLTIKGSSMVGGISGIIATQTLNGATVKNVTLDCPDRAGQVAGSFGGTCTISNIAIEDVTGATVTIGAAYKGGTPVQAKIGDTFYGTFEGAATAATAGQQVTLLAPPTANANNVVTASTAGATLEAVKAYEVATLLGGEFKKTTEGTLQYAYEFGVSYITYDPTNTEKPIVLVAKLEEGEAAAANRDLTGRFLVVTVTQKSTGISTKYIAKEDPVLDTDGKITVNLPLVDDQSGQGVLFSVSVTDEAPASATAL